MTLEPTQTLPSCTPPSLRTLRGSSRCNLRWDTGSSPPYPCICEVETARLRKEETCKICCRIVEVTLESNLVTFGVINSVVLFSYKNVCYQLGCTVAATDGGTFQNALQNITTEWMMHSVQGPGRLGFVDLDLECSTTLLGQ